VPDCFHQSIGYWNTAFHHGNWLQTTVDRPSFYEFDNAGGFFLPVADIGVSVDGAIPSGKANLHYVAEVTNGRGVGSGSDVVQKFQDENDRKAYNVAIFARPSGFTDYRSGGRCTTTS